MYGFKVVGAESGLQIKHAVAGGTIKAGDPIILQTDGQAELCAAGDPILGVAMNDAAATETVYYQTGYRLRVLADSDEDGDAMAADLRGARVDITGNAGEVLIDISTAKQTGDGTDTGQLLLVENNPQGWGFDDDTSIGLFEVIERQ